MKILVACARPGLIRAGQRHPAFAAYPADHFSEAQLDELAAEPAISLAVGEPISVGLMESYRARADARQSWWDFLSAGYRMEAAVRPPAPVVDQGAPSMVRTDPATALTGADALHLDTPTPGHAGVARGLVDARAEPVPVPQDAIIAQAEEAAIDRMHAEEAETGLAKSGHRPPQRTARRG